MRKLNKLAIPFRTLGVVCALSTSLTVLAGPAPKLKLSKADHSAEFASEIEAGKAASYAPTTSTTPTAVAVTPAPKAESKPAADEADNQGTLSDLKARVAKMPSAALREFSSKVDGLNNLNPEVFNDLVDKLPALSKDEEKDETLRQQLKTAFELNFEKMGQDPKKTLATIAREALAEKVAGSDRQKEKEKKEKEAFEARIADMLKKIEADDTKTADEKKKLEEQLSKLNDLKDPEAKSADKVKKGLDDALLAAALAGAGNDKGSGQGGDSSGGSPSGGGSGGGSGSGRGSGKSDDSKSNSQDPTEKKFSDLSNAFNSNNTPEEAKPTEETKSNSDAPVSKRKASEDETPAATTPTLPTLPTPDAGSQGYADQGRSLGPKSGLPGMSSGGGGSYGPPTPSGFGGGGGGGAGGMMPMQASMGGGGGGSSGGGGFPFNGPSGPNGGGVPQKFEYARANGYLNSSTADGGIANGEGYEETDSSGPVATMNTGSLANTTRAPAERPLAVNEPAFAPVIGRALGNLCASGSLDCGKSEQGKR